MECLPKYCPKICKSYHELLKSFYLSSRWNVSPSIAQRFANQTWTPEILYLSSRWNVFLSIVLKRAKINRATLTRHGSYCFWSDFVSFFAFCVSQGCISCGMCSYPELTKDHVLTSAYVNTFRTVTRNAVNKSVWRKKDCFWLPLNKHAMNIWFRAA